MTHHVTVIITESKISGNNPTKARSGSLIKFPSCLISEIDMKKTLKLEFGRIPQIIQFVLLNISSSKVKIKLHANIHHPTLLNS